MRIYPVILPWLLLAPSFAAAQRDGKTHSHGARRAHRSSAPSLHGSAPTRFPSQKVVAPVRRPTRPAIAPSPVIRPRPSHDLRELLRKRHQPKRPDLDEHGSPIKAKPPTAHQEVLDNQAVVRSITAGQKTEAQTGRCYWHTDNGMRYCHYFDRHGAHWYGLHNGPQFSWIRYYGDHWWWHDPNQARWLYYSGGSWLWQDPAQPQTVYVYADNGYAPYIAANPPLISNNSTLPAPPGDPTPPQPEHKSDVDTPSYQAKENSDSFAVVVGIETYSLLPKADFAARDGRAMRDHLQSLGYPVRNTMFLADDKAVRSSLEKYVEAWLPKQVDKDSRVFFYFAGHGAPEPKSGETYLMPWDADPKYLDNTGYPMKTLLAKLDALPAKQVFVVLDTCFSGWGGRSVLAEGTRPLVTKVDLSRGSAKHLVLFTASGADEITGTAKEQGHGLFTYYFLKGLNGAARASKEGMTVQDLYDYLRPQVKDAARHDNRDQSPQLFVPPEGQRQLLIQDLR